MTEPTSPWLTTKDAAARIRRHPNYIYKGLWSGALRGRQLVEPQGSWLIHVDDLDAWVEGKSAPRRLRKSA